MYCSVCGTKIKDGALFCSNCGTKVEIEETVKEEIKTESPVETVIKEESAPVEVKAEETVPAITPNEPVKAEEPTPAPAPVEVKAEAEAEEPVPVITPNEPVKAEEPAPAPAPVEVKAEEPVPAFTPNEPVKAEEPTPAPAPVEVKAEETVPAITPNEPVKAEEPAPAPAPVEVKAEEPVPEFTPNEPVKTEEVKSEPFIEVVNADGPIIENPNPQNIQQVQAAKPVKKEKPKKKVKAWVIILIIALVVIIGLPLLGVIVVLVCLAFGVGGLTLGFLSSGSGDRPEVDTSYLSYIDDYYGDYHGTSKVAATYNSKELVKFLASEGIDIDEEDLHTDLSESEFAISVYSDEYSDASWDMIIDYGDSFGYQIINNLTFVSAADWNDNYCVLGDFNPDNSTDEFYISVSDDDVYGMINDLLGIDDDLQCQYSMKFYGTAEDDVIDGTLKVTFLYDGMAKPFSEEIEVHAEK